MFSTVPSCTFSQIKISLRSTFCLSTFVYLLVTPLECAVMIGMQTLLSELGLVICVPLPGFCLIQSSKLRSVSYSN